MGNNTAHKAMLAFVNQKGQGYIAERLEIVEWCMKYSGFEFKNSASIMPSDCCYNRVNKDGSSRKDFLFEYIENSESTIKGKYRCLGENYPYTGDVFHKEKHGRIEKVGHWENGELTWF